VNPDFDFDAAPDTIRVAAPTIPPDALPRLYDECDDDEPTLVVVPSALAALAERSAMTTPSVHPGRSRSEEEDSMRRAVFGIWAVAAVLVAMLTVLTR
jgi:hypothetical protein